MKEPAKANESRWTTPEDVVERIRRIWLSGDLLRAELDGGAFSFEMRLKRPSSLELTENFEASRAWIRSLEGASKAQCGNGYAIVWETINHRVIGANEIPSHIRIDTLDDAYALLNTRDYARIFADVAARTCAVFPELREWIARNPFVGLDYADRWSGILATLTWFRENPRSGKYLRELDISGIDSKFIEMHKGVLASLLDILLPHDAIDYEARGSRGFEQRYGLRSNPHLIRFRILDRSKYIDQLSDISVPLDQFARLDIDIDAVFVTENIANGLAFPHLPRAIVIFGLGYGVEALSTVPWLLNKRLFYWGDIDTHGFAMLDKMKRNFPHVQSMLMNRQMLDAHQHMWTREAAPYRSELAHLNVEEAELYQALRTASFGSHVRLEQERIAFAYVEREIRRALGSVPGWGQ